MTDIVRISGDVPLRKGRRLPVEARGPGSDMKAPRSRKRTPAARRPAPPPGDRPQASAELFRLLVDSVADYAIFLLDPHGVILTWNVGAERIKGYKGPEIIGAHFSRFYLPEEIARNKPGRELEIAASEGRFEEEGWRLRKDGSRFWANVTIAAVRDAAGTLRGFAKVTRDFTRQRRAEEAVRKQAELLDLASDAILSRQWGDDTITYWNKGAERLYGWTSREALGLESHHLLETIFLKPLSDIRQDFIRLGYWEGEQVHRKKDGTPLTVFSRWTLLRDAQGRPSAILELNTDITARKQAEEALRQTELRLLQAQRMETLGTFAGRLAHDFNDLITTIGRQTGGLMDGIGDDHRLGDRVADIKKAADQAAALVQHLLAFSSSQGLHPRLLDLNALVTGLHGALQWLIGKDHLLVTTLAPGLDWVKVDPLQIEKVIVTLASTARDAMEPGGTLTIETANVTLETSLTHAHGLVLPGRYVTLALRDTGRGLDAEAQTRIFDPFFLTKSIETDVRQGLGLSLVYGIVQQSGGSIVVSSERGRGTVFTIYLPPARPAFPVPAT